MTKEHITGVAILYEGKRYELPKPNRHHHVIRMIAEKNGVGIQGRDIQGFVTNTGLFVNRKLGLFIAMEAGQVLDPKNIRAGQLFSEDLW